MRRIVLGLTGVVGAAALTLSTLPATSAAPASDSSRPGAARAAATYPALSVTRMVRGLDLPWDVKPLPGRRFLITERSSKHLLLRTRQGRVYRVKFPSGALWANGETGLMGLAVDPKFSRNKLFYTCHGGNRAGGGHDVRVVSWRLRTQPLRATLVRRLVTGIPATTGQHGGCRLLIASDGSLFVGTGDAATGSNPRNLDSLGGKTLRLNRITGAAWPSNPFVNGATRARRLIFTYGHRNVQGLSQRPGGAVWSAEHGPDRDDEVNRLTAGGDYGWHPVPGYDQTVPMTDQDLPGTQVNARWSSGFPTVATSGIAWVRGTKWGAYRGMLAVANLKASRVMFMRFDASGNFVGTRVPPALTRYGRLRSITSLLNGDLLVTTSNGNGRDSVLRVRPRG
ncbi:MAG: PQQ-dependent sugar dehydrogenase [Marmoricola sp.]